MKKKMLRRLTLNRETIRRLDEPTLHWLAGGFWTTHDGDCSECDCPTQLPRREGNATPAVYETKRR
jgi:hypothetical protein